MPNQLYRICLIAPILLLTSCGTAAPRPETDPPLQPSLTATWYGRPYHGRKTANGERYNMYKLTAAHRTLPFGTLLRVRNPENGKSVVVRINDRGPYHTRAELDLSYAAAKRLGLVRTGIARLQIRKIS